MTVTIFHNPKCSTSRKALELLQEKGVQPVVVEYLKTGWDAATLDRLAQETGVGLSGLLRKREAKTGELLESGASDEVIRAAMIAGTLQPLPISIGMKLFPESPNLRNIRSIMNATLAIYPLYSNTAKNKNRTTICGKKPKTAPTPPSIPSTSRP